MGWIPFDKAVKKDKNKILLPLWTSLAAQYSDEILNHYFYFPSAYNYSRPKNLMVIKISSNIDLNHKKLKKRGDTLTVDANGIKIRFKITGGSRGSGTLTYIGGASKNPSNNQQEQATIYAIQHPKADIIEISDKIGFQFDDLWGYHFSESKKFRDTKYYKNTSTIEHDATSQFASKLFNNFKKLGYKDRKDNWNPSDFWVLNKSAQYITRYLSTANTIYEYNDKMKKLFNDNILIGVSLKKIALGKIVKFDVVDPANREVVNYTFDKIDYTPGDTNFILKTKEGFNIRVGYKSSSGSTKIYFEGRMKGTKVQLGAISKIEIAKYFDIYDIEKGPDRSNNLLKTIQNMENIIKKDKTFLNEMYYLAMKQSKDSSIYLKMH